MVDDLDKAIDEILEKRDMKYALHRSPTRPWITVSCKELDNILASHTLTSEQIDKLLQPGRGDDIRLSSMLMFCQNLEERHIEIGLQSDAGNRLLAFNHQKCTEAQKVWYHLKYGD